MRKQLFYLFLISFVVMLTACGKKNIFEKHIKIRNATWNTDSVISFEVPINDIAKEYNIYIAVRHAEVYPFDNLYVRLDIYTPSGDKRSKDHYLEIRNEDRSFKGDVLGDIWDVEIAVMKNVSFNKPGIHQFKVINLMPYMNVPDVMEIGLIVEKIN